MLFIEIFYGDFAEIVLPFYTLSSLIRGFNCDWNAFLINGYGIESTCLRSNVLQLAKAHGR